MKSIVDWQNKFRSQPEIFYTSYKFEGQWEDSGNFYDSKEAAEIEVEWATARGDKCRVMSSPIHTLKLSTERWNP